jgi:hypothetical protein
MAGHFAIPKPDPTLQMDVNGGFLCQWVYWRPDPDAPDPDMPGLKQHVTSFIPAQPEQSCLCSSGKRYGACCRMKRYWHPICPNPDMAAYSLIAWQSATFTAIDGPTVRDRLLGAIELHDVEDTPHHSFWTYWGEPALRAEFGILCFGDFELKDDTLLVMAMSEPRMRVLLNLLSEIAGDCLGKPQIQHQAVKMADKRTGQYVEIMPSRARQRMRKL